MSEYAYEVVDVFTTTRFGGNPLAVITDARGLEDEVMQRIAAEFGFSETTFVLPPADARHTARVRIFTPTAEVPFAGHPNVGTAYVLARQAGVPLVLASDNTDVAFVRAGVKFRQIMRQRGEAGQDVKDNVLAVVANPDRVLFMERGSEGFFIVNKGAEKLDEPALDLTLTHLEGCYRELRNGFLVAIGRRSDGNKYVTRWGSWNRGGLEVQARDALYFIREPWPTCTS